ncbi:MAG: hypothetical protein JEZ08_11970 [Clostridiales bacterium]|nr:hypothetical protein [Clostridiales bacterium]
MKAKGLAKMLGIINRYSYEGALYNHDHMKNRKKDFLEETKLPTREGHLE